MNKEQTTKWRFHMVNLSKHLEGTLEVEYGPSTKPAEICADALAWLDGITNESYLCVTNLTTGDRYTHQGGGRFDHDTPLSELHITYEFSDM